MKSFLLGSAALIMLAGAAHAADLPLKAIPVKAPPPVSYDWTGFYVGGYYADAIGNQKGGTPTATTAINSRWSAKVETLYIDTGHSIHQISPPSAFGADFKDRFTVVRAGFNLKLGD